MTDMQEYLRRLELSNIYRESTISTAVDALQLPDGSCGLDAGCGNGFYTCMLAEAAGPAGRVAGIDIEESFLQRARALVAESGLADRISFIKGDITNLSFEDDTFDWAFSMDVVGNLPVDPVFLLGELKRTVKPGGTVYILNWTAQKLLPGYPALEARLNATSLGTAPFGANSRPQRHILRALSWFKQAGLRETGVRTFVGDITAPRTPEMREALTDVFPMRWGEGNPELSEEDRAAYRRLCSADSPEFILNLPDYYGYFIYSLFWGKAV